jgi:hypothetical protein
VQLLIVICVSFCGEETNAADHSFQNVNLTQQIHGKAVALVEERIVALLAEGDLVAIEAKYHRNCYTRFTRQYDVICKQNTASDNLEATAERSYQMQLKHQMRKHIHY